MHVKKIVFWVIVIFFLFVINNLIHSILSFSQKENLLVKKQGELAKQQKENEQLKRQLSRATMPQFVEEEARDKLFLTKPGESVLVIPTPHVSGSPRVDMKGAQHAPYWLQWWQFFF